MVNQVDPLLGIKFSDCRCSGSHVFHIFYESIFRSLEKVMRPIGVLILGLVLGPPRLRVIYFRGLRFHIFATKVGVNTPMVMPLVGKFHFQDPGGWGRCPRLLLPGCLTSPYHTLQLPWCRFTSFLARYLVKHPDVCKAC